MKVILVDIIPICEDFPGGEKKGMSFWIMFIQSREKNGISILCFQTIVCLWTGYYKVWKVLWIIM